MVTEKTDLGFGIWDLADWSALARDSAIHSPQIPKPKSQIRSVPYTASVGRAVLGIDAAWSLKHPSGVALVVEDGQGWRAAGVAPGYTEFLELARGKPVDWTARPRGAVPEPARLLEAARKLGGAPVRVAAVDMPLARGPITGRRAADNALTRAFIRRKCGVHTPNPERPGEAGRAVSEGFAACGFELATTAALGPGPHLIEVYPHAALIALLGLKERLEYKVARARQFWPECDAAERAARVRAALRRILGGLRREIRGIPALPAAGGGAGLKRFEDAVDALVCCWAGTRFLAGRAQAYGDAQAAIWVPKYDAT